MKEAVRIMENDPMVFRYAWFSGRHGDIPLSNIFQAGPGQLTQLGREYLAQPCGALVANALDDSTLAESNPVVDQNSTQVTESLPEKVNAGPRKEENVGLVVGTIIVVTTILIVTAVLVVSAILLVVRVLKNQGKEESP